MSDDPRDDDPRDDDPRDEVPAGEPDRGVKDQVLEDARRIRRAARRLSHGLIGLVLLVHLAATGLVTWVVFTEPFPYPAMYPLNGLLLFLVLSVRFTALLDGRRISARLWLAANLALHAFWVWALADQVPGRPIITGRFVARLDEPLLWVPIAMYVLSMAGMIGHAVAHAWHLRAASRIPE